MKEHEVRERAFAMPLTSPAFPCGPYRFVHREFFNITYRTDARKLRELVPEPLEIDDKIRLTTTRPSFGGLRWWFVCPRTDRHRNTVFIPVPSENHIRT